MTSQLWPGYKGPFRCLYQSLVACEYWECHFYQVLCIPVTHRVPLVLVPWPMISHTIRDVVSCCRTAAMTCPGPRPHTPVSTLTDDWCGGLYISRSTNGMDAFSAQLSGPCIIPGEYSRPHCSEQLQPFHPGSRVHRGGGVKRGGGRADPPFLAGLYEIN